MVNVDSEFWDLQKF